MTRALVLAVCVAGCADLPAFDQKCGNGVIDEDEDCDSSVGCDQCRATCPSGTDSECKAIMPGDYHCGADDICHAPSGVFVQAAKPSFSFVVGQGAVADLDGDRIGDVVGFSDITIDARFGDLDGTLATRATTLLPYSNATIAFRTFDTDRGAADILVPTPDGIAAYTASNKQLIAYPFAGPVGTTGPCVTIGGSADPLFTFEVDKRRMAFVSRDNVTGAGTIGVLDVRTNECRYTSLCGLTLPAAGDPLARMLVYDQYVTRASPPVSILAVGVPTSTTTEKVCAMRFDGTPTSFVLGPLTTPALATSVGTLALARTQPTDVCPTLFTPRADGIDAYAATGANGATCALATSPTVVPGFMAGAMPSGRIPLVPALANRGPDALVVINAGTFQQSSDVFALAGVLTYPMYHSPRPLYPVRSADLDGDGSYEAVASAFSGAPTANPDFDILYRTAPPIDSFVPYRITTQGVPTHFALGDFDGNGLADIAYTERVGAAERLMLAYSTPDRPLPAVELAKFNQILAFARVDVPDSIEPSGQVLDDLIIVDLPPMATAPTLTVLHGNPQRSMLAYFDPRAMIGTINSQFISAVSGNFDASTDAPDVMAFELDNETQQVRLWVANGVPGSENLSGASAPLTTNLEGLSCSAMPNGPPLCLNGARLLRWPIAGRDVLLAVDAQNRPGRTIVTIDPARAAGGTLTVQRPSDPSTQLPPAPFVFSVWGADSDGNGSDNLLLSMGGVGMFGGAQKDVLDCTVGDLGDVTACASLTPKIHFGGGGWVCQAAEPGLITARGRHDPAPDSTAKDILALCKRYDAFGGNVVAGHVLRLHWVGDGYRPEVVIEHAESYEFLSIGDINGDHVDDIAGIAFDATFTPVVDIHLQCEARDAQCRTTNDRGAITP